MGSIKYSKSFINKITSKVDPAIIEYHENRKDRYKIFNKPIESFVESVLIEELGTTDRIELRKIAGVKKKALIRKKNRYYKNCSDMVETNEWKNESDSYFYRDALTVYNLTGQLVLNNKVYPDFPSMEQEQLRIIKEWALDNDTKMIDFPGQGKKTPKAQEKDFIMDLTINILNIAEEDYGFDLSSVVYVGVDDISANSLFVNKKQMVKKEDLQNGKLEVYRSEDGKHRTVMTFPPDMFKKKESIQLFDSKDLQILSYLILQWEQSASTVRPLPIRIIDIYHAISGNVKSNPSANQYEDIWNRCYKMWALGFESYSFDNVTGGRRLIAECERDEKQNIIYIVMSQYLMDEIKENKIRKMPAEPLNNLEDNTARILYYPFMKQRVSAYETAVEKGMEVQVYPMNIKYESFLRWVNFGDANKKDNNAAIAEALEEYKEKGIFIKNYRYQATKQMYYIEFFALTDIEIQDLDFYFNKSEDNPEDMIDQLSIFSPVID